MTYCPNCGQKTYGGACYACACGNNAPLREETHRSSDVVAAHALDALLSAAEAVVNDPSKYELSQERIVIPIKMDKYLRLAEAVAACSATVSSSAATPGERSTDVC
jgi:hypothetical protein